MRLDDGRVISNFIVQALRSEPITIYGDGAQTRSFCFIDDLIDAFISLMGTSDDITGPMNLGNPEEFTIKQLAEIIIEMTGSRSELVYSDMPEDDPLQRCPNINLANSILNWNPTTKLKDGLEKTVSYFSNNI
jgi:UDP-glucuronate decarboxylase